MALEGKIRMWIRHSENLASAFVVLKIVRRARLSCPCQRLTLCDATLADYPSRKGIRSNVVEMASKNMSCAIKADGGFNASKCLWMLVAIMLKECWLCILQLRP
jgi:hypothetical protein